MERGEGLIGDGGVFGATVVEVGDVSSEDALGGPVSEAELHALMKLRLTANLNGKQYQHSYRCFWAARPIHSPSTRTPRSGLEGIPSRG